MKQKNSITTQPNWGVILLSLFMLYILLDSSYQEYGDFSGIFKDIRLLTMIILVIFILIAGRHYTFYNTHITMRLYGIPIKKYGWSEVNSIIYMHSWRDKECFSDAHNFGVSKGHAFMVSLNGCPPFYPEYYSRVYFSMHHPFSSIFFTIPQWKKDTYMDFFKTQYPKIRIQQSDLL